MDKRKFLYYNLHRIENNKRNMLLNYIESNEIEHSENTNGLLLNLSRLDDKHIDYFYDLYNLENQYPKYENIEKPSISIVSGSIIIKYKDYKLNPLEKLILSYS